MFQAFSTAVSCAVAVFVGGHLSSPCASGQCGPVWLGDWQGFQGFRLFDPWPTTCGFHFRRLFSGDALQQDGGWLVLRVLLYQLTTEGSGQCQGGEAPGLGGYGPMD